MTVRTKTLRNPLEEMPSILAVRDIRHRTRQAVHRYQGSVPIERELLALDPLTVLRCMRVAHSPIMGLQQEVLTIPQLCAKLGRPIILRALETKVTDVAGSGPARKLWIHSVATAHAARLLARRSGTMDPEKAYVLGLLHDLPLWLHYLSMRRCGRLPERTAAEWITGWNLPAVLGEVVDGPRADLGDRPDPRQPRGLIAAAELLAELADYWHPDEDETSRRDLLRAAVPDSDLDTATTVREEVDATLEMFGLDAATEEPDRPVTLSRDGVSLFPTRSQGRVADVVLNLLECTESNDYRGILTATTSATLRYLDFERAFFVQWSRSTGACFVRAKADLSPRPMAPTRVQPNSQELRMLEQAHANSEPVRVRSQAHGEPGLLQLLGSDDVLVTPLNQSFLMSAFLITDRALSARPIHARKESLGVLSVARVASLLVQNLLLKRKRARAQKFALTDPLTRIFNRGVGITNLSQEIARAKRSGTPLTVLMMDMDDFKSLNDTYGHLVGDEALRRAANVARRALRRGDTICRYGGEEFLVILPETSIEEASVSATRLFTAISEEGDSMGVPLTVSIGLASVRPGDDDVESVLSRADRALYASKARGRNRFSVDGD